MTSKKCTDCKEEKDLIEFYNHNYTRCKKCHSRIVIENQRKKNDKYNKYRSEYAKQNRERVNRWHENFLNRFPENHSGKTYQEFYKEKRAARIAANPDYHQKLKDKNKKAREKYKAKLKKLMPNHALINKTSALAKALVKYWSDNKGLN